MMTKRNILCDSQCEPAEARVLLAASEIKITLKADNGVSQNTKDLFKSQAKAAANWWEGILNGRQYQHQDKLPFGRTRVMWGAPDNYVLNRDDSDGDTRVVREWGPVDIDKTIEVRLLKNTLYGSDPAVRASAETNGTTMSVYLSASNFDDGYNEIWSLMAHEIGHSLGQGHHAPDGQGFMMGPSPSDGEKKISVNDIRKIKGDGTHYGTL